MRNTNSIIAHLPSTSWTPPDWSWPYTPIRVSRLNPRFWPKVQFPPPKKPERDLHSQNHTSISTLHIAYKAPELPLNILYSSPRQRQRQIQISLWRWWIYSCWACHCVESLDAWYTLSTVVVGSVGLTMLSGCYRTYARTQVDELIESSFIRYAGHSMYTDVNAVGDDWDAARYVILIV